MKMTEYGFDYEKERREAVAAGERALTSLKNARQQLVSASNWGVVDMLGGGFVSSMIKRSKMGNAREYMDQARYDLQAFRKELEDVNLRGLDMDMDGFLGFADYFFDGFFVDFMVQSKISNAKRQVEEAIDQVEAMLYRLK